MPTQNSELLKAMLQDLINDRQEQATVTMHDYFVSKTREVAGLETSEDTAVVDDNEEPVTADETDTDTDDDTE